MPEAQGSGSTGEPRTVNDTLAPDAPAPPAEEWAHVEIFGHRSHYGRIAEVERFGTKMMRIDVPTEDLEVFETFFYGGGSVFSMTPMTEEACRAYCARYRPRPVTARSALPPPELDAALSAEERDALLADEE